MHAHYYTYQNAHDDITEQFRYFKKFGSTRFTRMLFADNLIEHYFFFNEESPGFPILDRLGTLILLDEYSDKDLHKMEKAERPFQSEHQLERLRRKETKVPAMEYDMSRIVGRKVSSVDGRKTPIFPK